MERIEKGFVTAEMPDDIESVELLLLDDGDDEVGLSKSELGSSIASTSSPSLLVTSGSGLCDSKKISLAIGVRSSSAHT